LNWFLAAVALALTSAAPLTAHAQDKMEFPYAVVFFGVDEFPELVEILADASKLVTEQERPPATERQLRRRIDDDLARLNLAIRAESYYAGKIDAAIDQTVSPALVTLTVQPGPRYLLTSYTVLADNGAGGGGVDVALSELGLTLDEPAQAASIVGANSLLLARMAERGYPLAAIDDRKVVVDHDRQAVDVTVDLALGPLARFGEARIVGNESVANSVIGLRIQWLRGAVFDSTKVASTRDALRATQLFDAVRIDHAEVPDVEGNLPMTITVTERPPRSIGAGVGYSTAEGLRAKLFWEHRNLFGGAERLRTTIRLGEILNGASASFVRPDFLSSRQELLLDAAVEQERTDAFTATRAGTSGRVRRSLTDTVTVSGGVALERSIEEDDNEKRFFTLVTTPLGLGRDSSDDALNPTRGGRGRFDVTPSVRSLGSDVGFVTLDLSDTRYIALDDAGDLVLAGRYRLGVTFGAETDELPADRRYYAGGGGSVRGYALQAIGPRDQFGDPSGGRSLAEIGAEVRWRVWGDIGVVPFIEGGQVFESELPEIGNGLRWGAGLGLRYFTAVGPLRVDFAVPLQRRRDIDDAFQFYISLGQAF
jgi:translocation and assembly module TamA